MGEEKKKIREEKGQRIHSITSQRFDKTSSSLLLLTSLSFFLFNKALDFNSKATSFTISPMARSNVPKFGNWEAEENVPYTAYFDKARKTRAPGGKITNPNDPGYNSDSQSQAPPPSRTKPEEVDPVRRSREHMRSREESELKQFGDAGGSSNEAANKRQGRASQNNSYDKSPLHKNSYDGTGKSKPKPANLRADESPEKVTVVPKFGDWDENNPASADGYTHIFNKVREERSSGANVSGSSRTPTHPNRSPSKTSTCCCFGFGGK